MAHQGFDLAAAARQEMIDHGFAPDFPAGVAEQLAAINPRPDGSLRDLRPLLWSSIDNDDSRDLDQIEWAERAGSNIRVLVAIADVEDSVAAATPIDRYAAQETTTVYTGVRVFPCVGTAACRHAVSCVARVARCGQAEKRTACLLND